MPVHAGTGAGQTYQLGETGGTEQVTLTDQTIPIHTHAAGCTSAAGNNASPAGAFWASNTNTAIMPYNSPGSVNAVMAPSSISTSGGSNPHDNMLPFLCVNFIISLFGIFPHS